MTRPAQPDCRAGFARWMPWVPLIAFVAQLAGCAGQTLNAPLDSEDNTLIGAIGSKDFRSICSQMAQSLIRIPAIQNANSPPTCAFIRVDNASSEIMDSDDFLYKMRKELIANSGGKLTFLDREHIDRIIREREAKERGDVTSSSSAPLLGADYFLTGRISGLDRSSGRTRTVYLRFSFRLTNAQTNAIVWEDDYEVKKYRRGGTYDR